MVRGRGEREGETGLGREQQNTKISRGRIFGRKTRNFRQRELQVWCHSPFQAKVVKLQRMINILHERYTQEQLDGMPQYQRLMSLYSNLRPLLPGQMELDLSSPRAAEAAEAVEDDEGSAAAENEKRAGVNVEFMGMKCCTPAMP